jgi:mannose-6-phosphate isomerase-like protein (cupin superfamily)
MVALGSSLANAQDKSVTPKPRVIQLNASSVDSMDVFKGPPDTFTMRSGYMVLAPGKSVGRHSTRNNEEVLIVLAGEGEMTIVEGPTLKIRAYNVAYCPPSTEHNVTNTGTEMLRYIWLVSKAKWQ